MNSEQITYETTLELTAAPTVVAEHLPFCLTDSLKRSSIDFCSEILHNLRHIMQKQKVTKRRK